MVAQQPCYRAFDQGPGEEDATVGLDRRTRLEVFSSPFPIGSSSYVVGESVPPHVHDFIELGFVTRGHVRHATVDDVSRLGPGHVAVIRPGTWHAFELEDPGEAVEVTNAYLGAELVHGQLSWVLDYPQLARLLLWGGRLPAPLPVDRGRRVAGWLAQLSEEQDSRDTVIKTALLGCVLVELARAAGEGLAVRPPSISPAVRSALQSMNGDLAHQWTVTELAHRAGISESSLYRQFRTQLGNGPVEWLTRARAERAATLLSQTDLPIAAIGRRVGWPDPSYASRRFHRVYGVPPKAYRAAHAVRGAGS
jgi:AraC family L-rhamnose operon transcriptional activator RhaR